MAGMSIRGYAEHRKKRGLPGGQHSTVIEAIKSGRITGPGNDGKIDPDVADEEWAENTRASEGSGADAADYHEARARRELARAKLAEIEVAKAEGLLVPRDVVEQVYGTKLLDVLRAGILNMPGRWGSQIVGLESPREGEAVLKKVATELLEEFSGAAADQLESGGAMLPDDCPVLDVLVSAGIETMSDLLGVEDLTDIPGIGKGRARKIQAWLEAERDAA